MTMTDDHAGGTPATHTAPEDLVSDADPKAARQRAPIKTVRGLGKAFLAWLEKSPLEEGSAERIKFGANDPLWSNAPIELANSWHREEQIGWNFCVFEGRLVQAVSDRAMARGGV
jgi:hypothetical protein